MKNLLIFLLFGMGALHAQNNFFAVVRSAETGEPLLGSNVYIASLNQGDSGDSLGQVFLSGIPSGKYEITFSYIGYRKHIQIFEFPIIDDGLIVIYLENEEEETEEVLVSSTRGKRNITDEPERVEVINAEELSEKANMKASNITMLLNESPGIHVQQVSALSQASYFRIQGLDGKYTQLLSDGIPFSGGLEGGLSLLQISPLDLQRVEIIKGSASTLYGGGAIAGVINLISKEPQKNTWSGLINRTSNRATDLSLYRSDVLAGWSYSIIANQNFLSPVDIDADQVTEIPKGSKSEVIARGQAALNDDFELKMKASFMHDEREGGDYNEIIENKPAFLGLESNRTTASLKAIYNTGGGVIDFTNSGSVYRGVNRLFGNIWWDAFQYHTFHEITYTQPFSDLEVQGGLSLNTTTLTQKESIESSSLNFHYLFWGMFTQVNIKLTQELNMTAGVRYEINNKYPSVVLPRLALLYKPMQNMSLRLSGGLGYMLPEVFSEITDIYRPLRIKPLNFTVLEPEKSAGLNADVNMRGIVADEISWQLNLLGYYNTINKPIVIEESGFNPNTFALFNYVNYGGKLVSSGFEVTLRTSYEALSLFLGHSISDTRYEGGITSGRIDLNPRNKFYAVLVYEEERNLRVGLESYYTGQQESVSEDILPSYWIFGLMAEKVFSGFSLYINFENFTNTRQDRMGVPRMEMPPGSMYKYNNIFAPLEGFTINGGIKMEL